MKNLDACRKIAFDNGKNQEWTPWECRYHQYSFVPSLDLALPASIKRARLDEYLLNNITLEVNEYELLIGRMANSFKMNDEKHKIIADGWDYECSMGDKCGWRSANTNHRCVDYEKILNCGIKSVLQEIDELDTGENKDFYEASRISLKAVLSLAERCHGFLISSAEKEANKERRAELLAMAENFAKAPYEKCTHFYEAVQTVWFMEFCFKIIDDISVTGRADRYLYPFYKADIESGYITEEFAFEIINHFYFKHNELYNNWPAALMLGGVDREGKPVWNDLTRMFIKAISTCGLVNPAVSICYTEDMPDDIMDLTIEALSGGYTRPAIFNDKVVQKGLIDAGVEAEDARDYMHSCCVEITPCSSSDILIATPYVNLVRSIDYILCNKTEPYRVGTTIDGLGVGWGGFGKNHYVSEEVDFDIDELDTFDKFYEKLKEVISKTLYAHAMAAYEVADMRSKCRSAPLTTALIGDCLKRGKDSGGGGAKYDYIYPCFPGAINLIDSIMAIKKAVYEDKIITLSELGVACKNNLTDEKLREYLIKCPKFGNEIAEVDEIGKDIYDFIYSELQRMSVDGKRKFYPSYFAWVAHGIMGNDTMATPDGRRGGEALSEHLGSVQGRDLSGPTAVINSIANLDQTKGIGGIATNFKFTKDFLKTEKGKDALKVMIEVFMEKNCFEMQFNVVSREDLIKAQENPESYQTLMVRVAGFSDYFVRLGKNIQDEIIRRTEIGEI